MCGITAYSRAGRTSIPDGRRFARAAALAIESRGQHATGFGWSDPDDAHPWYWKQRGKASRVVQNADLPIGMRTMIGHTRHATMGDPKVYVNNHPVIGEGFVLVHNGRIDNHEDLIELSGLTPRGTVDSEALPLLLTSALAAGGHPTELLELVEGVAAIAWINQDTGHDLHLARLSSRPMTYAYTTRGDFVMSSTPQTLAATERLAQVKLGKFTTVPEGTYMRVVQGEIVETVKFAVNHPRAIVPLDMPGGWDGADLWPDPFALPSGTSGTPSVTVRPKPQPRKRKPKKQGEIDWDNLVPRRGWAPDRPKRNISG